MASRYLLTALESRSAILSKDYIQVNRKSISQLSSNKSPKSFGQSYFWTDEQHEQWIDRKFGRLEELVDTKKKSSPRDNTGKQIGRNSN